MKLSDVLLEQARTYRLTAMVGNPRHRSEKDSLQIQLDMRNVGVLVGELDKLMKRRLDLGSLHDDPLPTPDKKDCPLVTEIFNYLKKYERASDRHSWRIRDYNESSFKVTIYYSFGDGPEHLVIVTGPWEKLPGHTVPHLSADID